VVAVTITAPTTDTSCFGGVIVRLSVGDTVADALRDDAAKDRVRLDVPDAVAVAVRDEAATDRVRLPVTDRVNDTDRVSLPVSKCVVEAVPPLTVRVQVAAAVAVPVSAKVSEAETGSVTVTDGITVRDEVAVIPEAVKLGSAVALALAVDDADTDGDAVYGAKVYMQTNGSARSHARCTGSPVASLAGHSPLGSCGGSRPPHRAAGRSAATGHCAVTADAARPRCTL
jgi:hypothetical protein